MGNSEETAMSQLALIPARTAVLSLDLQRTIVKIYTKDRPDLVARAAPVLSEARKRGMTVIHVRVGFRPRLPEVSARNPLFGAIKNSPQHQAIFEGAAGEFDPGVAPESGDITVVKHRVSAFAGTDLEMILRANGIDTLVLFGIATSGVVLSTLLDASDADYRLVVVEDCCADLDATLHSCLVERLFPIRATVMTAGQFVDSLRTIESASPAQSA
jgi:nicotinamidase-related amidase